jgi:two-component system, chemotaxis family, protein-glutamate methylesterase/glutaminase
MIRVLIAEDSSTVRMLLQHVLTADSEIRVIGTANDGLEAIAHTKRLKPDLVVMDINMPKIDGLQATKHIMIEQPTPIIIVSATRDVRETSLSVAALNAGALALLSTPSGVEPEFEQSARQLVATVKAMAGFKLVRHWPPREMVARAPRLDAAAPFSARVVAIGASTGGPSAIAKILSGLPSNFPAPILMVQHIAKGFAPGLASWLNTISPLKVKIAAAGEQVMPSTVYVAGDDTHLAVSQQLRIRLDDSQPIGGFRPSITHLFESAARAFGQSALAVILTGMGQDGVAGLRAVRNARGRVIAQDELTSVVFGMPGAAIAEGLADLVLPLPDISEHLMRMAVDKASSGTLERA